MSEQAVFGAPGESLHPATPISQGDGLVPQEGEFGAASKPLRRRSRLGGFGGFGVAGPWEIESCKSAG
jgi:hypothetical protein